jgi:hypothetical protein
MSEEEQTKSREERIKEAIVKISEEDTELLQRLSE